MDNKIPHILHVFDGFRCGGTELRTCKIINGLGNKFHHTICSINGNFDAAAYINPDIEYSLIHCPQKGIIYPVQIINIYKKLRQIKPDLLIAYAWGSIDWLIANLFDQVCPSIHAAEGFDDSEIRSEKYHRKLIRGFVFKRCCLIVTCSRLLKDMATDSWNVKKKNVIHIVNGVKVSHFKFNRVKKSHSDQTVRLGIVASLIKLKNHARLIHCLSQLPNELTYKLYVAGDGPELGALEKLTEELNLTQKIKFLGYLEDPTELLRKIDIFCFSSDIEQMPMAILEAMASGLPIVSTDVGDIKQMVSQANKKFIVKKNDEKTYVSAMWELIKNHELRQQLGLNNRSTAFQFYSEHSMIESYAMIYLKAISGSLSIKIKN